jgi:pathogenesis-related protein 1
MLLRRNLPLLLTCLALAACTTKQGGPAFGDLEPDSLDDSGSTATDGGSGDDVTVDQDASTEDASMPPASTRKDAGRADAGRGVDASETEDAEVAETGSNAETGRLEGITAAHNAVRAMVTTQPPLPDLTWSPTLAAYAQEWATQLASSPTTCASPQHRSGADLQAKNYGENLAAFSGRGAPGNVSTAQQAVDGWSSEVMCWTYGTIRGTEKCNMTCTTNLNSDGCGHYTQVVWRKSIELGCGVATCQNGQYTEDIWICNYSPAGNVIGQAPY